jgi:predicted MFS family arabinose efflux permease
LWRKHIFYSKPVTVQINLPLIGFPNFFRQGKYGGPTINLNQPMNRIKQLYIDAFGGLSKPAWMLSLVMLINRSGAMVIPFLSIYLTEALGYSIAQAGVVVSCFGIGSMIGAFLGGWLTDRIGHFKVQFFSLVLGGALFIVVSGITEYHALIAAIIVLSAVAESLRPANASSVAHYAKPENVSRAFSLNRMAINLGFSVGPAIGGLLAAMSFRLLFIADGLTCIAAGIFFFFYFRNQKEYSAKPKRATPEDVPLHSPYRDPRFLLFIVLCSGYAILFFQLFVTLPLYYRDIYLLPENKIGGLLALKGILVFALEMVMVYILGKKYPISVPITSGALLLGVSFVMLNLGHHVVFLFISMFLISISEILAMPFMATYIVQKSSGHNRGAYMGLYTLSFSVAHVIAPFIGSRIIEHYGYTSLWWFVGLAAIILSLGFALLVRIKPKGSFVPA